MPLSFSYAFSQHTEMVTVQDSFEGCVTLQIYNRIPQANESYTPTLQPPTCFSSFVLISVKETQKTGHHLSFFPLPYLVILFLTVLLPEIIPGLSCFLYLHCNNYLPFSCLNYLLYYFSTVLSNRNVILHFLVATLKKIKRNK